MCLSCFKSTQSTNVDDSHDLQPPRIAQQEAQKEYASHRKLLKDVDNVTPPSLGNTSNQSPAHVLMTVNGASDNGTDNSATHEPTSTSADVEAAGLWKEAYTTLAEDDPDLIRDLETIIKEDAGLGSDSDIKREMQTVVTQQKTKMESKQWSFNLLGIKEVKVRETVDSVLSLIDRSQSLISAGMTFAPVYISIPWTAVSSLIPVRVHSDFLESHDDEIHKIS